MIARSCCVVALRSDSKLSYCTGLDSSQARTIVKPYEVSDNGTAFFQVLSVVIPYLLLVGLAIWSLKVSYVLTVVLTLGISFILARAFVLMHDCGHGSLFETSSLNRLFGFILGVVSGMPQMVWSSRHAYHHATNGNWEKYGGPLGTIPVEKYESLSTLEKYLFQGLRHWWIAPLGGFIYLVANPRIIWVKGTLLALMNWTRVNVFGQGIPEREYYWKDRKTYWHMTASNACFLLLAGYLCHEIGVGAFSLIFLTSLSLAGAAGLFLFTAQHNFENSYASGTEGWNYYKAALEGTSYLALPAILNWMTADIGYHHVHHLSSKIPNYRLKRCHEENAEWFAAVPRLYLRHLPYSISCILWDKKLGKVVPLPPLPKLRQPSLNMRMKA